MIKDKIKNRDSKQEPLKPDLFTVKRTQPIKVLQKISSSPLRSSSQDYYAHFFQKNYILMRSNLSSEKKNRRAKASVKSTSNQFYLNNLEVQDQFSSKQKSKHKEIKQRRQNKSKKQINFNLIKEPQHARALIKQKQKQKTQKQPKQFKQFKELKQPKESKETKTKLVSFKTFIGSKLRRKLESYLLFLNIINYSIRIKYKAPEVRRYTVYIGKGNNSKLVKKLFARRFWWKIVTKPETCKLVNLVWSQWSKLKLFDAIPRANKIDKVEEFILDDNIIDNENKQVKSKQTNKEAFLKKLSPQTLHELEHVWDLLQTNDKRLLYKRAFKKELKHENMKEFGSKQITKKFKKMKISLTHNHIENHQQFTNKKNLFINLKNYYQEEIFDIVPLTFHVIDLETGNAKSQNSLDTVLDYLSSLSKEDKKEKSTLWIVKPGENSNRGSGIEVFKKIQHIKSHIEKEKLKHQDRTFIVQKYLNPFLYHRRKFDIRCYLLVTCTPEIRAYYYPTGYIRTSSYEFTTKNCSNRLIHLTNDAIQKKQQEYGKFEKGNKVRYDEFQKYLDLFESKRDLNFYKQIIPKIQEMMNKTVKVMASKDKERGRLLNPSNRQYCFELYGYDFMIDENFVPWLIQINTNPCIETGCEILQDIIPGLLENVIKICIDTVFPPPKLEEWPLNEIFACPESIFEHNEFQLIYSQFEE